MGCDMVIALNQATVQGNTLVGLNLHDFRPVSQFLRRFEAAEHAPDEVLHLGTLTLPQVRRTCRVLGSQTGMHWGLTHGINEHRVAAGFACWQSKLPPTEGSLLGSDLVRLTLERSHSARHAFDILTDLVSRHGQRGLGQSGRTDSIFLLADPNEAFVVEAVGCHWAMLECRQVRAVSDVGLIRQDWSRLAPGLAELAISHHWWADDGSKLDVADSLAAPTTASAWPLKRWGKATLALEQQSGHIDPYFLRFLLNEHFDSAATALLAEADHPHLALQLLSSFIAVLPSDQCALPVAWCSYGPSGFPLYFPILLDGELPPLFDQEASGDNSLFMKLQDLLANQEFADTIRKMLDRLQNQFDEQLEEFLEEMRRLQAEGNTNQVRHLAGLFMQSHAEKLESELQALPSALNPPHRAAFQQGAGVTQDGISSPARRGPKANGF